MKSGNENSVRLWRGVLTAVLCAALVMPAWADNPRLLGPSSGGGLQKTADEIVIGIVVAAVAVVVVVAVLIHHYESKKRSITGCVSSGAAGMNITDEKDRRNYTLSGDTQSVKPGERMKLEGKRKDNGGTLVFEAHKVTRDFGPCQP